MNLLDHLRARIAADGPLNVAEYMEAALTHPTLGYYTTRDPLGAGGDFTTAPEISQMFGELIGLCLAQTWLDQGLGRVTLAELGPGRGTLMADALRATRAVPGFHVALDVVFVEASEPLRTAQREAVPTARWVDRLEELPEAPLLLIANEFFDALPIRQYTRDGDAWRERLVESTDGGLTFTDGPALPDPHLERRLADT
ncbi:MAG: SAM-dependent methyltransferase, partial [Shimia sp.]